MAKENVSKKTKDIQSRFFQALERLIDSGKLKGLQTFCKQYDLQRPKYSNLRSAEKSPDANAPGYKFIDIDALAYLVEDFGVSADWLLIGEGGMFK